MSIKEILGNTYFVGFFKQLYEAMEEEFTDIQNPLGRGEE